MNYEAPHYAFFTILLLFTLEVQIFSSAVVLKHPHLFSSSLSMTAEVSNPYEKWMKQNNSTLSCPQMTVFY
jgi:hypothetical protein